VLISCWSAKGGSGTTVVAASLALLLADTSPLGALLVDLAGDVPTVLGMPDAHGPGIAGWLAAGDDVPSDALVRLESPAGRGLAVLPRGDGELAHAERSDALAEVLARDGRPVVVDCGVVGDGRGPAGEVSRVLAAEATHSLLVIRLCYLALRRALVAPVHPSGVVLLTEQGRALSRQDVEDVLGVEIKAEIDVDREVARRVDAGLLVSRLPRALARGLRDAA
jgi:hypothetical protein